MAEENDFRKEIEKQQMMSEKMLAIPFVRRQTDPMRLKVQKWPRPLLLSKDDVMIAVRAFGLNFADILARKGQYQDAPNFPFVPGYEVAGKIVQVGENVTNFKIGDDVIAFCNFGGYAEFVCVHHEAIWPLPSGFSYAMGASIPVVYSTAWHILYNTGRIRSGDRVLIHSAAGGLGQVCVEMIKAVSKDVIVIGTCGSDEKVELLRDLGIDHAINYNKVDYVDEIKRLFPRIDEKDDDEAGRGWGVDVILNSLGGDSIKKDLQLLRAGGRVVAFGGAVFSNASIFSLFSTVGNAISMVTLNAIDMMIGSKSLCTVNMKRIADNRRDILREDMDNVLRLISDGKIKVRVTTEMDWHQIGEAHQRMEDRLTTGKVVLTISETKDILAHEELTQHERKRTRDDQDEYSSSEEEEEEKGLEYKKGREGKTETARLKGLKEGEEGIQGREVKGKDVDVKESRGRRGKEDVRAPELKGADTQGSRDLVGDQSQSKDLGQSAQKGKQGGLKSDLHETGESQGLNQPGSSTGVRGVNQGQLSGNQGQLGGNQDHLKGSQVRTHQGGLQDDQSRSSNVGGGQYYGIHGNIGLSTGSQQQAPGLESRAPPAAHAQPPASSPTTAPAPSPTSSSSTATTGLGSKGGQTGLQTGAQTGLQSGSQTGAQYSATGPHEELLRQRHESKHEHVE